MKVSVLMITYNHAEFIAQAIDSILMQKVNFDYEIIIGEDCSKDSTRDIVINYKNMYPERIKLLLPEKNLGMQKNFLQTFNFCQGEYIATLEGDDYWTDTYKLQKQVDFLESHPSTALCYSNVLVEYHNSSDASHEFFMNYPKNIFSHLFPKVNSTLKDIIGGNFIPVCSVMFRSGLPVIIPEWMMTIPYLDWPFCTLIAEHGNLTYLNEIFGVYRVHSGGVHSSVSELKNLKNSVYISEVLNYHFNFKYQKNIEKNLKDWYGRIGEILVNEYQMEEALFYLTKLGNLMRGVSTPPTTFLDRN